MFPLGSTSIATNYRQRRRSLASPRRLIKLKKRHFSYRLLAHDMNPVAAVRQLPKTRSFMHNPRQPLNRLYIGVPQPKCRISSSDSEPARRTLV
ncbi:hypothetical protein BaRGS_00002232 [Batillaria attramentaria]|uniref:Uncharacterized protein n=1 Tax=Batillaria attramentaria TaxID=370345 RepID=A0ABD0M651_9CAEN